MVRSGGMVVVNQVIADVRMTSRRAFVSTSITAQ